MSASTKSQDAALLVLRLIVAAVFLYAGMAKWVFWSAGPIEGMTPTMLNLTKFLSIVEPLGAVALIAGFLTRWAAAGLALIMAGASYFVYFVMQAPFFTNEQGSGLDYILLLLGGCLILIAFGGGRWSVDELRK